MLEINNLTKYYQKGIKAVDSMSLTVESGDIYGFIGENGAGKTTAIKCICGILPFEEGEISVEGHSVKTEPTECKKRIAYIPDTPELYGTLTGSGYINFISDLYSVPMHRRRVLIEKYSELFGMTGELETLISSYSHGMKQKAAIIAALVHSPRLLVLDEPFVALDPKAAYALKNVMKEICIEGGAVFFSTHVLEVAEKLCNKVSFIKNGKVSVSGKMTDILGNKTLENVFLELSE